jgi:hypothetical protein
MGVRTEATTGRWWDIGRAPTAIYGTIISASVLAASDETSTVFQVAAGIFITLLVYWLAERWSELIAGVIRGEHITRHNIRRVFLHGWPMVEASYGPMLVLIIAALFGASTEAAIAIALVTTVLVLAGLGALVGRKAKLSPWGVVGAACFVGFLGILLIGLKAALH